MAPVSVVVMSQSDGPVALAETVTSWAVSFLSVRSNLNSLSDAPVSSGVLVVSVMLPAASALTRIEIGSTSSAPPPRAVTRMVDELFVASAGTVTSSRAVPGLPGAAATASTTLPPPMRLAVQPLGMPLNDSATSAARVDDTVRSKLTLLPGATATAGYGVVTSSPFVAPTVGAKIGRTSAEMTSAAVTGARRATLLCKVSLLGNVETWSADSADESAKVGRDDTTTIRFRLRSET